MSDCNEVLFVSDASGQIQSACCFDPHIGTTLMSYKGGGGIPSNTLSYIGNEYVLSASVDKLLLNLWQLNSSEPVSTVRTVLAGKATALTVSPDGLYCTVGIDGKIYIWHISSGTLLTVVAKHYQEIRKIMFLNDSSHFITCGNDGLVFVWRLADLVQRETGIAFDRGNINTEPVYSLGHHSLPVTDMHIGHGDMHARLFTVSMDQTCKIYNLTDGSMLVSIVFDYVLTSVLANALETQLFVGTKCGKIVQFGLDTYPRSLEYHSKESDVKMFVGHAKAVTCMSASMDGFTIASGSDDAKVVVWNIRSQQQLRVFEMKGPITNLQFRMSSRNMFATVFTPNLTVNPFKRTTGDAEFEASVVVNQKLTPLSHAFDFEGPFNGAKLNQESIKVDGGGELVSLKQEVEKLKTSNKELYLFAMENILNNPMAPAKKKSPGNVS